MILTKDGKVLTSDSKVLTTSSSSNLGQAKLVAKAIPVPTIEDDVEFYEGYFKTDIPLKANKFYLLKYYSDNFMMCSTAIVTTYLSDSGYVESSRSVLACYESYNENLVPAVIVASDNSINIYAIDGYLPFPDINGEIPNLVFEPNDYIEIYELPFTLGGE